jgi:flagellar protein FliS
MSSPRNSYTSSAVTQAEPVKLVEMMYAAAIRFGRIARRHIEAGEVEPAHHAILRTYAIVAELMATLDFERGGEIARNLEQCYDFMLSQLKQADMLKDLKPLDDVLGMLIPLHGTWCESFGMQHPLSAAGQSPASGAAGGFDSAAQAVLAGTTAVQDKPQGLPLGARLNIQG